jgi:hypothetical protein
MIPLYKKFKNSLIFSNVQLAEMGTKKAKVIVTLFFKV